jgi:hypothetical protein
MDLRSYYDKLKRTEESLTKQFYSVVPVGASGPVTEVNRGVAAKLLTDGVAELVAEVVESAEAKPGRKKG